jgi:hypothetical protein
MIGKASGSPYSHVELWLDGPQNAARCFSSREPSGASFMVRDLTTPEWEIVPYHSVIGPQDESNLFDCVESFCEGANGKSYDMAGLLGYKLGTGLHDDHDVFCSEVVSECLQKCAGLVLPKDPWMTSPGDLYKLVTAK